MDRIEKYIEEFKREQERRRYVLIAFNDEGVTVQALFLRTEPLRIETGRKFVFRGVTEKNFGEHRVLKSLLQTIFFPFPYRIVTNVSHAYCHSKYFTMHYERGDASSPVTQDEINTFFSQNVWKHLEQNKKEFSDKGKFEDLNVLLVANHIIAARTNKEVVRHEEMESLFEKAAKSVDFGVVQTFLYRPIYTALTKIMPKRAHVMSFLEDGFSLALALDMARLDTAAPKSKPRKFIYASIRRNETDIFFFNGESMELMDSFNFGHQSLYEAFNTSLQMDYGSYIRALGAFANGETSSGVARHFGDIISKELGHLYNGLMSFKKATKATAIYIDGGEIAFLLRKHKKFASWMIDGSIFGFIRSIQIDKLELADRNRADVIMALCISHKNTINSIVTKIIRWLIPYTLDN